MIYNSDDTLKWRDVHTGDVVIVGMIGYRVYDAVCMIIEKQIDIKNSTHRLTVMCNINTRLSIESWKVTPEELASFSIMTL